MATYPAVNSDERATQPSRPLAVHDLGLVPYRQAWDLQRFISEEVGAGSRPDTLLLFEHPHTYTCGRRGGRDHILASERELEAWGVEVLDVDRGGDVTYHGPGQMVAYPIINLARGGAPVDYPGYVRSLEAVLMGVLADFDVASHRLQGLSGVWIDRGGYEEKIAAIGVKVDGRGISSHGIALNVTTDLRYFGFIIPCGIQDKGVTSLHRLVDPVPSAGVVRESFIRHLAEHFGFSPVLPPSEQQSIVTPVERAGGAQWAQ